MSKTERDAWMKAAAQRAHRTEDATAFILEALDRADEEIARQLATDPEYARLDEVLEEDR